MTKEDFEWKLLPINPFTPTQQKIIEEMINSGKPMKEVAQEIGYTYGTIRKAFGGHNSGNGSQTSIGIRGIIEQSTGKQLPPKGGALIPLIGDVLFPFKKNSDSG